MTGSAPKGLGVQFTFSQYGAAAMEAAAGVRADALGHSDAGAAGKGADASLGLGKLDPRIGVDVDLVDCSQLASSQDATAQGYAIQSVVPALKPEDIADRLRAQLHARRRAAHVKSGFSRAAFLGKEVLGVEPVEGANGQEGAAGSVDRGNVRDGMGGGALESGGSGRGMAIGHTGHGQLDRRSGAGPGRHLRGQPGSSSSSSHRSGGMPTKPSGNLGSLQLPVHRRSGASVPIGVAQLSNMPGMDLSSHLPPPTRGGQASVSSPGASAGMAQWTRALVSSQGQGASQRHRGEDGNLPDDWCTSTGWRLLVQDIHIAGSQGGGEPVAEGSREFEASAVEWDLGGDWRQVQSKLRAWRSAAWGDQRWPAGPPPAGTSADLVSLGLELAGCRRDTDARALCRMLLRWAQEAETAGATTIAGEWAAQYRRAADGIQREARRVLGLSLV